MKYTCGPSLSTAAAASSAPPPAAAAAPQASASGGAAAGAATSKDKSEMAKLTEAVAELNAKEEERHATLMAQVKSFNWVNDAAKVKN